MEKDNNIFLRIFVFLEKVVLRFSDLLIAFMVLTTFVQVILRYCFNSGIRWVEEMCCLAVIWYSFISMAFGVVGKEHVQITMATRWLPGKVKQIWDRVVHLLVCAYGVFMIVFGIKMMGVTAHQTLPATKLAYSVMYAAVPFGGILLVIMSLLVVLGLVQKHPELSVQADPVNWEDE